MTSDTLDQLVLDPYVTQIVNERRSEAMKGLAGGGDI